MDLSSILSSQGFMTIIGILIVISLVMFLLKSLVKATIVLVIALVLFQVGFVWNGNGASKIPFASFLKPQAAEQLQSQYNTFAAKRDATGVLDSQTTQKLIDGGISQVSGNKEQIISTIVTQLKTFDPTTVSQILAKSQTELAKYNITTDEVQKAIDASK